MRSTELAAGTPQQSIDRSLVALLASGLPHMLDAEHQLFCFTLHPGARGMVREGISRRYTMMALLGLDRLQKTGQRSPVQASPVLDQLTADTSWVNCIGDLGLLLWTVALLDPHRLPHVARDTDVLGALARYKDGIEARTMELAWFSAGLCYSVATKNPSLAALHHEAHKTFRLLAANQGTKGIFRHAGCYRSIPAILRGRIGSFADQVYPIYAIAQYARLTGSREAIHRAANCAETICQLQGPLGEWWWHYDADTGHVLETYPVYSVHQYGMAPMALFAISEISGRDFNGPIHEGISWIEGQNEIGYDMRCEASKLIWRSLQLPQRQQLFRRLLLLGKARPAPASKLKVNQECRPYELGWGLYAWAGR